MPSPYDIHRNSTNPLVVLISDENLEQMIQQIGTQ